MRRRLFWTIAGVAAVTGFLVLAAGVVAGQRAAVSATYREMAQSSAEIVDVLEDAFAPRERRPEALRQLFTLAEQDPIGPLLLRIRRAAGGSELAFGAIRAEALAPASAELLHEVDLEIDQLLRGDSQFIRSPEGELVVVTPATIQTREGTEILLVALARNAPVVRAADQIRAFIPIAIGVALIAAVMARLLSNQVADRLAPLASASRRVAEGDMSARVPDLEDQELDEVAKAFNEMATALQESDEREREFILGVGHDLRTPLTTITGYAEALETGEVLAEDLARIGKVLGTQTRQLSRLIEDLAMLARLEQPEFDLRAEEVD
ncbi:MAG: histidine kinase dimerization/phospho-acceptor domain-containing protein, partial [Acidimicrobiia bacterium]|nr:histidine kinase dimerization/phospho-acceptor domain-containing protein [Acidimicrobiia bacterium]